MIKRIVSIFLALIISASFVFAASAEDFKLSDDNTYTITVNGKTPGRDYTIVVVAGDYTGKEMPEISEENIIYIDQVTADSNGVVSFTGFIPMTESVGTVYIGGDDTPSEEGILATESGFGYIAGRLISYSGDNETVVIPDNITSVDAEAFDNADNVKNAIIKTGSTLLSDNAFAAGTKLFISPLAISAKEYALNNGLSYAYLGDISGDDKVDINDYKQLLGISASGEEITDTDLSIILDLDFNGDVNFRDLSVLLQFIGNKIGDYYEAYKTK